MKTLAHFTLLGLALFAGIIVGEWIGPMLERAIYRIKRRKIASD